jgi:hypothetical protein
MTAAGTYERSQIEPLKGLTKTARLLSQTGGYVADRFMGALRLRLNLQIQAWG